MLMLEPRLGVRRKFLLHRGRRNHTVKLNTELGVALKQLLELATQPLTRFACNRKECKPMGPFGKLSLENP